MLQPVCWKFCVKSPSKSDASVKAIRNWRQGVLDVSIVALPYLAVSPMYQRPEVIALADENGPRTEL